MPKTSPFLITPSQINFSETRRLAAEMVATGEKIIQLLTFCNPTPCEAAMDLKLHVVMRVVGSYFNFSLDGMRRKGRKSRVVWARQVAMYLARELTHCTFKEIAIEFNRDHGCVINAIRVVKARCDTDERCRHDVLTLQAQLTSSSSFAGKPASA